MGKMDLPDMHDMYAKGPQTRELSHSNNTSMLNATSNCHTCLWSYMYKLLIHHTVRYKILEGENFGEMAHCNNWWIIIWQIQPKI